MSRTTGTVREMETVIADKDIEMAQRATHAAAQNKPLASGNQTHLSHPHHPGNVASDSPRKVPNPAKQETDPGSRQALFDATDGPRVHPATSTAERRKGVAVETDVGETR